MRMIVAKVPEILYRSIKKIEKDCKTKGLNLSAPQISHKLGYDLFNGHIKFEIIGFMKNNTKMVNLGGPMDVKIKKR